MSVPHRVCAVVPTYNNPLTVRSVVEKIRTHALDVVLVDDGSAADGQAACRAVAEAGLATLHRLEINQGKGAACVAGFRAARELGYTHAFQVDADGQHDLDQIPAFLAASRSDPSALVVAYPIYDQSVPSARKWGRLFTSFWIALEVGSRTLIKDALIGFRVYPLEAALSIRRVGRAMEFDIDILVRMVRTGVPVINLPVGVRYPTAEEGGVSHFHVVRDNVRFSILHARLCTAGVFQWLGKRILGRPR